MFDIGSKELIVIAVVLVLLFGSRKIPELAKNIVQATRQLRGAFKDEENPSVAVTEVKPIKKR